MTFLAPVFLWAAAAAGLVTTLLHLLAWRRPRAMPLPTTRFIPERPMRVVARAVQPSDLRLLALRLLLITCVGVALARPVMAPARRGDARVILADVSRAVASPAELRDSVLGLVREGDVVLAFDSASREISVAALDSLTGREARPRGRITAALVAAVREAGRLSRTHDSVAVYLVSPIVAEEWDAATVAVGNEWPGALHVVRVRPAVAPPSPHVSVRAAPDDPVLLAVARSTGLVDPADARVHVVRETVTADDSVWVRDADRVLVAWPSVAARTGDTLGAVVAGSSIFAASLVRGATPPAGLAVARWADAAPATTEARLGAGCVRTVAIPVPLVGDAALSAGFSRFVESMVAPCGGAPALAPVPAAGVSLLERETPAGLRAMRPGDVESSRLPVWLLAAALLLVLLEPLVRRRERP